MKNRDNEKYFKIGVTAVAVIVVSLLCFFLFFQFNAFIKGAKDVLDILAPFVIGIVIAYLMAPVCTSMEELLHRRIRSDRIVSALSILFSLVLVAIILWALLMMVIPQVCRSVIDLALTVPGQLEDAIKWVSGQLEDRPEVQGYLNTVLTEAEKRIQDWMQTDLIPTAQAVLNDVGGRIVGVFTLMKNILLGFIASIYLLASRKKLAVQSRMILYSIFSKKWAELIEREVRYADKMFSGFLIGKLVDSAIIGVICYIGVSLLKFPSPLLIGTIIGVTNIIPFFGPFIGAIPCALLLLLENPWHCLTFVIFILVLQQVDGNIIGPKILGNSTGLSSFWVLFAILLFGGLWGFAGMIVGVPLFAVIYDVVRQLVRYGLKKHGSEEMFYPAEETSPEKAEQAAQDGTGK